MFNQEKSLRLIGSLIVFFAAFLLMFAMVSISANAEGTDDTPTSSEQQEVQNENEDQDKSEELRERIKEKQAELEKERRERQEEREKKAAERRENRQEKLDENRLKACENREENINKRMEKIAEQRSKQVEVFKKISERTQEFYKDKNLSLANYDELVADVEAKQALAEDAIEQLKSSDVEFDCSGEDPLGIVETFKDARDELRVAMKDYKTSVKNLIVGVKSAATAGGSESGE